MTNKYPHPCRPDELKFSTYCLRRNPSTTEQFKMVFKELDVIKKMIKKLMNEPKTKSLPKKKPATPKKKSPPKKASVFTDSARKMYLKKYSK